MPELELQKMRLKETLDRWVFKSIESTYEATRESQNGTPLAAFLLISCAIDFLSGFHAGLEDFQARGSGQRYRDFLESYFKSPHYTAQEIWASLRCSLAHNYNIGHPLALSHAGQNHGQKFSSNGVLFKNVNYEDFYREFRDGVKRYFSDLENNVDLQERFLKRARKGWVGVIEGMILP